MIRTYGVAAAIMPPRNGENTMTPTTRWAAAQRRKRQVINQTVIDRALRDPDRLHASSRTRERAHTTSHAAARTTTSTTSAG
jgi:hypothetical protein